MNLTALPHTRSLPHLLALGALATACGGVGSDPSATSRVPYQHSEPATLVPPSTCVVRTESGVAGIRVSPTGLAMVRGDGQQQQLHRYDGVGCDLTARADLPILAMRDGLLDIDDAGNVYVVATESYVPDVLSTTNSERLRGVTRIDADGVVDELINGGRWVAGLTISPAGDELATHGCSPTGLYRRGEPRWTEDEAVTAQWGAVAWRADPVALGDGVVAAATADALVRITASGSEEIAPAQVDFGTGPKAPRSLTRCGTGLCGVFAAGVATWSAEGELSATVTREDLDAAEDEEITQATGDGRGVYVLLRSRVGERVVFVPATAEGAAGPQ